MNAFWPLLFWAVMVFAAFGFWRGARNPAWAPVSWGVLWLLLAILGAYAIGLPGLPGK